MKYIVFGAGGFLGKKLAGYLREQGDEVIAVVHKQPASYNVDITAADSFQSLNGITDASIVINCASFLPDASLPVNDVVYLKNLFETNVIGAINILNFAAQKNIKRVINCSTLAVVNKPWPVPLKETDAIYPKGTHIGYCLSKLSQELIMNEVAIRAGVAVLHLRLSALYGPGMKWQGIMPMLIDKALKNETIQLTNAQKVSFDFLFIDDLLHIIRHLSQTTEWKECIINVASGEEVFLRDLAEIIIRQTNSSSSMEFYTNDQVFSRSVVDISLLKSMLKNQFSFTSIKDGIRSTISSLSDLN
ncbi:MAG: NAD(P)-dependent oxidoreductase [Flavisolibacter sp.]|nr:NAD(P)-dependent oxidoreductase [Flavisolibacter sp.]